MPSANRDSYTYSFPTWMPFISFSCLVALAVPSSTMLNRSDEHGHACFVTDLRGELSVSLPLSIKLVFHRFPQSG